MGDRYLESNTNRITTASKQSYKASGAGSGGWHKSLMLIDRGYTFAMRL